MNTIKKSKRISSGGFTIVETIVSVGIFTVVFVSVVGAFLSVLNAYQKVTATRVNVDNLTASLESLVRGAKTGEKYHCGVSSTEDFTTVSDCSAAGGTYFGFTNTSVPRPFGSLPTDPIVYRFENGRIERSDNGAVSFYPVTVGPPELTITYARFYVLGSIPYGTTPDVIQPMVTMIIKGTVGKKASTKVPFSIQTMVTQRRIDIE